MAEVAAIGVGNILVMMQEIVDNETMDQAVADVNSVLDFGGENESLSPEEDKEAEVGAPDVEMQSKIGEQELSIEELVAKARAPIKKEFLTAAGVRVVNPLGGVTGGRSAEQMDRPVISKRQLKKNREQARKSTANICAVVAKTRDPSKCLYGAKCRFNHDLEVYLAQKPPDLPGNCPSLEFGEPCSYSLTCRFAGTHKEFNSLESCEKKASNIPYDERNMLRKDYQKILWKNKGDYPKADAQLQAMGLMGKAFKLNKTEEEERVGPEGGEVIQNTLQLIMGAEAMDTSEGHVDAKLLPPEILKTLRSAIGQVGKSAPVSHASMMSSHPSKRHKSTSDSVTNEDINGSKGDGEEKNVTGAEHMSISAEISPSAMNVGDAATVVPDNRDLAENNSSHQLQHEIEHAKPSANHVDWRILYLESKLPHREKKLIDFRDKLYLAPLTTVGNLPFRRVCKALGADITCGEMAMCRNLLQGAASEWALLRRHSSEDVFGVQICGGYPDHVARTAEMIERECDVDFIDVNVGCPIDLVVNNGAGSCLLTKPQRLEQIVRATAGVMEKPLTLKLRMGYYEGRNCAHSFMPHLYEWGVSAVTIHGRTRQQRYSKVANWDYVYDCTAAAPEDLQVIGNGDIMAYTDWDEHLQTSGSKLATCMIARGALVKPWLFTEIKERRHWDISSSERLDILRKYAYAGLAHWGSDAKGVEVTRKFLLEWLSYMHRYIPVGLLEVVPQRHNWRPPSYFGRNDLETMMASESAVDWVSGVPCNDIIRVNNLNSILFVQHEIKISEMLLGPVPADFVFQPKHKSNAYDRAENG